MFSRKQQLIILLLLKQEMGDRLAYLDSVIREFMKGISQKVRFHLKDKVKEIELEDTFPEEALLFLLHAQNPKESYMAMLTRELIEQTDMKFEEERIIEIRENMKQTLERAGLELPKLSRKFLSNIAYYEPEFKNKYPNLDL